jgi:hypothetical protein
VQQRSYTADRLWYGFYREGRCTLLSAASCPFALTRASQDRGAKQVRIQWTHPLMHGLIRFTVGPRHVPPLRARAVSEPFDAALPYPVDELELLGVGMVAYTLGVMADQPEVDLGWDDWSSNLAHALAELPDELLIPALRARRDTVTSPAQRPGIPPAAPAPGRRRRSVAA